MKIFAAFLILLSPLRLMAETQLDPKDFSNPLSQQVAGDVLLDGKNLPPTGTLDKQGRDQQAKDAKDNGLAGGIVATAIGGTLIAIGTRMLFSPDLTTKIAGADLMAKGGAELAQGIANIASAGENEDQEKKLTTYGYDNSKNMASAFPADVKEALASKGIDPDLFQKQLSSGNLDSAEKVMSAVGDDALAASDDQRAAAAAMSQDILSQELGKIASKESMGYEETPKTASEKSGGGGFVIATASGPALTAGPFPEKTPETKAPAHPSERKLASLDDKSPSLAGNVPAADLAQQLRDLIVGEKKDEAIQGATLEALKIQVARPIPKLNIFQIASQNYRRRYDLLF